MNPRTFRYVMALLLVILAWAVLFDLGHAQTFAGADSVTFSFTTPTYCVDDSCHYIPSKPITDLFVAYFQMREDRSGTQWQAVRIIGLNVPTGGELVRVRYMPPASGRYRFRVMLENSLGITPCPANEVVVAWNIDGYAPPCSLRVEP